MKPIACLLILIGVLMMAKGYRVAAAVTGPDYFSAASIYSVVGWWFVGFLLGAAGAVLFFASN